MVAAFSKQQILINDIENFTRKIAKLLLEKLQFSSQICRGHNSDNFLKLRIV
jgi:hypothetical protein